MLTEGLRESRQLGKSSVKPQVQKKIAELSEIVESQQEEGFVQQFVK